MKATHPATTISNIVLSSPKMINTKDRCPSDKPSRIMHQPYSKCSIITSKMIISKWSKRWSHQARLPITSQPSSYKINPHTHDKISDNLIKQPTNPHIVNHPKIIRYPSPCEINPGLKLLTLYLVESERGCERLEKPRMERSYSGLKGDTVQSSQWMDVGQSKVKVREVSKVLLWS